MIQRELIKKLKRIEIRTSRLANEQLAGSYHSIFKGRGMAFSEVRKYQPGDDVRFIDWNVSARMNDAYVKIFTEEREMTVMLLVDLSASELFGSQEKSKSEIAAEIAALLAFSAIKNNDRVGLILFTDHVERFVPPQKGRGHVMRVVTEILNAKPQGRKTSIHSGLEMLGKVAKRRSVAFVISDFLDTGFESSLRVASKRHDLIPIVISDPREKQVAPVGLTVAQDLETGECFEIDLGDPAVREEIVRLAMQKTAMQKQLFRRMKMDHVQIDTSQPYIRPIVELFRLREQRIRGFG